MTDMKNEMDSDLDQNYSLNSNADPKNMQELTIYVSISTAEGTISNIIILQLTNPPTNSKCQNEACQFVWHLSGRTEILLCQLI